ncbi:adenine deaminase C-terminal domain-containing protein [Martelella endophytica]|uniref:Adenine deaminase C-terminal domain-containing protein n=1 Tax=Martelella endophytica TaxID=1486262 RepID=A0A0D5LKV3_MAREN|nr:adenine deaminase C-terminal domain-containing protein [Martelella endophytica]AJY44585.1 hypothetical protein TM49_01070 [Martelella endophytica]
MQDCRTQSEPSPLEDVATLPIIEDGLFDTLPGTPLPLIDFSGPHPVARGALPLASLRDPLPEALTLMARIDEDGALLELCGISGLGRWRGALATTGDDGILTVFGCSQRDMAVAANAVIKAGGGLAVTEGDWINALIRLPGEGMSTDFDLAETAREIESLRNALDVIVDWKPPFLLKKLFATPLSPTTESNQASRFGPDSDYPMVAAE